MASYGEVLSKKLDRVRKAVEQFPAAASALNGATDQLGKSVSQLDAIFKKFSFGIPIWVPFDESDASFFPLYDHEDLGYAKIGGRWGVAIRVVAGDETAPRPESEDKWLFNDAPRLLRVRATEVIPELLEALLTRASEMTKKITERAHEVDALAAGMSSVLEQESELLTAAPAQGWKSLAENLMKTEAAASSKGTRAGATHVKTRK